MVEAPTQKVFRKNVAAVIVNKKGLLLACRRADKFKTWQLPQGGIDDNESPREALLRELLEEIGTAEVEIIGELKEPISYEWPERLWHRGFHGQKQWYFLLRLREEAVIVLDGDSHQEFEEVAWVKAAEFLKDLDCVPATAYRKAIPLLQEMFPGVIAD